MRLSIIVPAHNEEKLLPETLRSIRAALDRVEVESEVIVVDNASVDRTPEIAEAAGARVISELVRNIGRVRNTGATSVTATFWFS